VQRTLANTTIQAGGQNIYRLAAGVGGTLQVTLTADGNNAAPLILAVLGSDGHTVLYTDPLIGVQPGLSETFTINVTQGQVVFLEVSGAFLPQNGLFTLGFVNLDQYESTGPKLVESLQDTVAQPAAGANLFDTAGNFGPPDTPNMYRVVALTGGTLQATITGIGGYTGNLRFRIYAADGVTLLKNDAGINRPSGVASGQSETLSIQVTQGEVVLLEVSGVRLTSPSGSYTIQFSNFVPSEVSGPNTLFIPTAGDPTSIVAALLAGDTTPSLLTTNTNATDSLSVLKSNGDGTFQAPQEYDIGPGQSGSLTAGTRQIAVADLTGNGAQDVIVPNFRAADVSVLLGNGAGGFQPQRNFDAVADPDALVTGDFGNGHTDVAVLQNFPQFGGVSKLAILQGRGDGTFEPAVFYSTIFGNGANSMITGDFNGDGHLDIIVFSKNQPQAQIFFGKADGTFTHEGVPTKDGSFTIGENTFNAAAVDLDGRTYANGKPILDLITTSTNSGNVYVQLGHGDGTFQPFVAFTAMTPRPGDNVGVHGLAIANFPVPEGTPLPAAGLKFGTQGIIVTAQSRSGQGAAQVLLLPELVVDDPGGADDGQYFGYGAPIVLANVGAAGNIAVGNFGSGGVDLAVADKGGVTIIYGKPLKLKPTRDLGDADHVVTQTQAIVTGHEDAFYTYTVPKEVVSGAGDQVIDFSALFQYVGGAGLKLDVFDATSGKDLGSGSFVPGQTGSGVRFRVTAAQGDMLQVHVSGLPGTAAGFGAYTLDIDVLPQVVSVQAESALPGGPATSLVLTFQGDRLDPTTATLATNYMITVGGVQVVPVSVTLDPAANTAIAGDGLTYATAARQTVTLSFAAPLPVGTYEIALQPGILAAPYSTSEAGVLVPDAALGGHVLVSAKNGMVHNGSDFIVPNLVTAAGSPDPAAISNGTAFLTQLQNDLSAILNSGLQQGLSDAVITSEINAEIASRFAAGLPAGLLVGVIWLDPVSLTLQAPQGTKDKFDNSLANNTPTNNISQSYVSVGGNVELVVVAGLAGTFQLDVKNVPQEARGGAVTFDANGSKTTSFTEGSPGSPGLQQGGTSFSITLNSAITPVVQILNSLPGQVNSGIAAASPGSTGAGAISSSTVATVAQTGSALLFSALLTGFPQTGSGSTNLGGQSNGNVIPTNGSSQTSSTNSAASLSADGGGSGSGSGANAHSSLFESAIDRVFLDLPDSVAGFVDLADGLVQESADAARILRDQINAFFKSQLLPAAAPMAMPPESLRPTADLHWKLRDPSATGSEVVANAPPAEYTGWRANEYGLTLFLASGLSYIGLRDLAGDNADPRKKRRDIPLN
jgi:hypothetical protein